MPRPRQPLVRRSRARITIPDVLFLLMSIAGFAALWPVLSDLMAQNSGTLGGGETLLFRMILPLALLVIFSTIYVKAIRGVRF